tara:strand:- start:497 stop:778 length:282 start_codon:yes stop_codon:yes gene_type:complete
MMNTERKTLSMDDLEDFQPRPPRPSAAKTERKAVQAIASFPSREASQEDQLNIKGSKATLDRFRALRKAERYPYAILLDMLMDAYEKKEKNKL